MTRQTVLVIIVLIAILGVIYVIDRSRDEQAEETVLEPIQSVAAVNKTQNAAASEVKAHPGDELIYTLTVENATDEVVSGYVIEISIPELLRFATLIDAAGANYNSETAHLSWTPLDIPAQGLIQKQFSVRVKEQGELERVTTDQEPVMSVTFNNQLRVAIAKGRIGSGVAIENNTAAGPSTTSPTYRAPNSGLPLNFSLYGALLFTAIIFLHNLRKKPRPT